MTITGDRVVLLRALRGGHPAVIAGLCAALVIGACAPVGMAVALGVTVSRVQQLADPGILGAALPSLLAFGAVALAGHAADAVTGPLESAARAWIDGVYRRDILRLTTGTASLAPLEDPQVQGLIRRAGAERTFGLPTPADGALTQLRWFAGLLGVVAACVVVGQYKWWLVPFLLVPAVIGLHLRSRQYVAAIQALRLATKEELNADVWRKAAASAAEGKDVRVYGFAQWMVERMQRHIADGNRPFWSHISLVARRSWIQLLLTLAGLAPVYAFVTWDAARGGASVAVQTAVLIAAWTIYLSIGADSAVYQMAGAVDVLDAYRELRERIPVAPVAPVAESPPLTATGGRPPLVRFENVHFRYPGTAAAVIDGLNLEIRPGELLAIVGLNGAGKSTLIKLLAGLYEPDAGRITADGAEIGAAGWDAWRARMSVVFQDFIRYELSAADNVLLGQAQGPPDMEAAAVAAAKAGFDPVLRRLPQGWRTPLGHTRRDGAPLLDRHRRRPDPRPGQRPARREGVARRPHADRRHLRSAVQLAGDGVSARGTVTNAIAGSGEPLCATALERLWGLNITREQPKNAGSESRSSLGLKRPAFS